MLKILQAASSRRLFGGNLHPYAGHMVPRMAAVPCMEQSQKQFMSYKLKTKSAAKKRFRRNKKGSFFRNQSGIQHLNVHMERKRVNELGKTARVHPTDKKRVARMLKVSNMSR
eukprot:gb/GECG01000809.1/.p1 GENE.gb/GECG01000809.1/~~gb/GECG01000809.1/.p1  ORF type:complete len:113 (+),score=12.57 gb/GECG01000809.1/:1-339(+)